MNISDLISQLMVYQNIYGDAEVFVEVEDEGRAYHLMATDAMAVDEHYVAVTLTGRNKNV